MPSRILFIFLSLSLTITNLAQAGKFPIGINTNEVMQVDSSVPFVNLFKMSLPFDEANAKLTRGNISYDRNGWPKNLNGGHAGTNLIHWLPAGTLPDGNYTVLYDGQGKIEYTDDAKVISSQPGKDIIHIAAGHDKFFKVTLIIKQSNPKNYIKNIRVLIPGGICANNPFQRVDNAQQCRGNYQAFAAHHQQIVFNPDYLRFMKDFDTIRFMNMSGITRNPLTSWNQLPHMQEATWAGKEGRRGAPLQVMVALANKLNRNAWFNIPERANDDLVRRYAQYVKQHLRPNLKAYIEYTNEAWNPTFTAARYVRSKGAQQGLGNDHNGGHKYYVTRAAQIMRIWKQVFGNSSRVVRVMGAWSANPKLTKMLMEYNNTPKNFDAVAIAPYFFVHQKVQAGVNSVPSVFKLLKDDKNPYSLNNVRKMIGKQQAEVSKYRLKLIAYEGGQHLYAPGNRSTKDVPTKYYVGANRAWPMEKMYTEFLQSWNQETRGGLFTIFSSPRTYQAYGSWGIKEHINQPAAKAPKYRGVKKFL
ncbi:MAG: hypothetical protein V3U78_02615 [Thiotrichaceae bacterium]